ncbi:reticulon-4-like [Gastrophryne carolinensis]
MDLQHASSIATAGKEDLSSLLLESTTTSIPSLSPLSAGYPKGNTATVAFPADSTTTPDSLQGSDSDTDSLERKDLHYAPSQGQATEDATISEQGFTVEHPTSEPEAIDVEHTKVYAQSAKEMFSGMLKSVGPPHEEFTDLKEEVGEHYVDFKPFASTTGLDFAFESKDPVVDFKSSVGHLIFQSNPEDKSGEGKDVDMDISDDISPASPEAISDSSQYETFAPLQQAAPFAYGSNPFTQYKPEEKKTEEINTGLRLGSNVATVNPFLEHVDYVTTDSVSASALQASSKPEGLTPDIVQEAYESEGCDVGIPKLNYEPKIDLVQTIAKAANENVTPSTQNAGLFEDSESVSSPVLPDIVMEAPLTAPVGLSAISSQPDVSPVEHVGLATDEKLKFESEKPLLFKDVDRMYEEEEEEELAEAHVEPVKEKQAEVAEAPYISIACDLIKETIPEKATDFSRALKNEFDSQYTAPYDESSPESEPSEPSYKHWESEVILKEAAVTIGSVKTHEEPESEPYEEQALNKAYLESESYLFDNPVVIPKETVPQFSSQEKTLQTEAFGKAKEVPHFKETVNVEKSPTVSLVEDFVSKPKDDVAKDSKPQDARVLKDAPKKSEEVPAQAKEPAPAWDKPVDFSKPGPVAEENVAKPMPPAKGADVVSSTSTEKKPAPAPGACRFNPSVVDLLYWRDIKKSGAVFGASLFLLLSLTVFSIVSVSAYIALALLSITISFRIYKGVLQAIQKSEEGHPFKAYLDSNVAVSEDLVQKYCNVALGHINKTIKELRRLFLVEDLVDSLKFAVLMWVFTYIGALFNGLTLLILALISLFSIPVLYERHQVKVDHYLALITKNVNNVKELVLSKVPGLKRKAE